MTLEQAVQQSDFCSAQIVESGGSGFYIDRFGTPFYEVSLVEGGQPSSLIGRRDTTAEVVALVNETAGYDIAHSGQWEPLE